MKFNIISIFPHIFGSYFDESMVKRAQKKGLIGINIINLRDYAKDKHKTVDDTPYGGGPGMVMKVEPIYKCIQKLKIQDEKLRVRVILFSAKGKRYTQKDAVRFSKYDELILICGRYEVVDERVAENIADEEISIGDYILTGGEIPAMILVDSITRLIPGVLGNPQSLNEESFTNQFKNLKLKIKNSSLEYPQYTKPENFQGWQVPNVLISGHHAAIKKWREKHRQKINQKRKI